MAAYLATAAAGLLALYILTLIYGSVRQQLQLARHFEEQSSLFRARADSLQKARAEEIQKTQDLGISTDSWRNSNALVNG